MTRSEYWLFLSRLAWIKAKKSGRKDLAGLKYKNLQARRLLEQEQELKEK